MEKVDIFDQEVGRAAIECNGNLVVVFNGKKAFGSRTNREFCKRASRSSSSTLCVLRGSLESRRTLQVQEHRQFLQFCG